MSKKFYQIFVFLMIGFISIIFVNISSAQANENLDLYSHHFRPSIAMPQRTVSFSFSLIPEIGSTNLFEFKKVSTAIAGLMPDSDAETILGKMQEQLDILNSFQGMTTSPDVFITPRVHFGFNTKYLEFRFTAAAKSTNQGQLNGLVNELHESDFHIDLFGNYSLNLGETQTLFSGVTDNLMGGDTMLIGKIPLGRANMLIGSGAGVAYRYRHIFQLVAPAEITPENKIYTNNESFSRLIWGINALAGFEYLDAGNNFNPRIVFEARKLYSNYLEKYKPEFNMGFVTKLGKAGYFVLDILKLNDPKIKMEYMKTFLGNNEIAVGGVLRNDFGPEHLGYVALGLGGNFIKFNTMCFFTKDSVGGMVGLSLGWQPK